MNKIEIINGPDVKKVSQLAEFLKESYVYLMVHNCWKLDGMDQKVIYL